MGLDLHWLKSVLKPALARFPALQRRASVIYQRLLRRRDAALMRARHPGAEIVHNDGVRLAAIRKEGFRGQLGQDHYLWSRYFAGRGDGIFVEIGCSHPTTCNNSYFFERQGWRGHAIDAQDLFADLWRDQRSTPFHHAAIAGKDETRAFVRFAPRQGWESDHSGFADHALSESMATMDHEIIDLNCRRLSTLLPDLGAIDLLMIDVEGAEREVLEGIDLDRLAPRCILIENNRAVGGDESLRDAVCAHGYRLAARINAVDDVFEREGAPS